MEPVTPDNTRVVRLLGDFQHFMTSTQLHSRTSETSPISFNISDAGTPNPLSATSSKRKFNESKDEVFSQAKLAQAEHKHACEERAHKFARLTLESQNERLQSENRSLKDKTSSLQTKLNEVTRQAIKVQDELNESKTLEHSKSKNLEESFLCLQKTKDEIESSMNRMVARLEHRCQALQARNTDLTRKNSWLTVECQKLNANLEQKTQKVEKFIENQNELMKADETVRAQQILIKDLEMRLNRAENAEKLSRVVQDDLRRLQKLELDVVKLQQQNDRYRDNETNVHLMKEKVMEAEEKLKRNEKLLEKSAIIELENRELLAQLNEEKNRELKQCQSSDDSVVLELRQREAINANQIAALKTDLSLQAKEAESYRIKIAELENIIADKANMIKSKDVEIQTITQRATLMKGECQSLRGILQSYDSEMVATPHAEQLMKRVRNAESTNDKLQTQLHNAQKSAQLSSREIAALRQNIKDLERKLSSQVSNSSESDKANEIESLRKMVEDLEHEKAALRQRNERLELWAERNTRRGDFDPSVTKVFHFRMNPADLAHKQARNQFEEMKEKCRKLQEKIFKLESDQDVTTTCLDITKVKELEDKLASSELKNLRLKEVFGKKIQDFRQACYSLTGFRIDAHSDDHFKLISRYAENERDFLLFCSLPSGGMQLLETDYSKTLESLIKLHLHHQNSIPMFLSSLTAELFSQQTDVTSRY